MEDVSRVQAYQSLPLREYDLSIDDLAATDTAGCLHEIFEAQVDKTPHAIALIGESLRLTYRELDARANRLARLLRFYDVGPGKLVGLFLDRSEHPTISILACLKAGAAYVPIDPVYPADRIKHILEESRLSVILSESLLAERARSFGSEVVVVDELGKELSGQPEWRLTRQETGVAPSDLGYVIYTSGTTGRPKGVMTEHRNAFRFVHAFNEVCGAVPTDRIYQGFSLGFDGSVEEMWMAFSNGAALVVPGRETPRFGNELARYLTERGVTYFSTVPTLLSTLVEDVPTLRFLVVSGEACPPDLVARWARPGRRMLNVYGPTEATVNTTCFECFPDRPVTIGRPLRGYDAFVLDAHRTPVPPGIKGELYIGGDTLARGYLNQPQLTAERFVDVPHLGGEPTRRLYRTGDLVRWNDEGELEFFGRIDSQVKIRGYRVELAEIEALLLENTAIRSASVKLFERDGLQELAAYVVLHNPLEPLDREAVLSALEARLPSYMIPGYLDVLPQMPMLTSGKTDRHRLPAPVAPLVRQRGNIVEPANELETKTALVWARVLGLPRVSVEDDFFLDLGGHSLLAAQMVTRLRAETGREVAVRDAYRFPTVRKLCAYLTALAESASWEALPQSELKEKPTAKQVFESLSSLERGGTTVLQAASLYFYYALLGLPIGVLYLAARSFWIGGLSTSGLVATVLVLTFATWPALLALSIIGKWTIIGRYQPGRHPVWGLYYFRWWLVNRLHVLSGSAALAGTPLMTLYFRLMGAKVGRGVVLNSASASIWDGLSIDDDTSIGADTQMLGYRIEDGMLVIGNVTIGKRCFVGIHSAFGLDTVMEDDSRLDDQSLLPDRERIPAGEGRRGSPSHKSEVRVPEGVGAPWRRPVLFGALQLLLLEVLGLLLFLPAVPLLVASVVIYLRYGLVTSIVVSAIATPFLEVAYALYLVALKRTLFRGTEPGTYPLESVAYLKAWLSEAFMSSCRRVLLPLYTTLYFPHWLRLMGAKIGARAELSSLWRVSPEHVEMGEESFFADGCTIGGKRVYLGQFRIDTNRVGRRTFVGNSSLLPVGANLGDRCLLGVVSVPPTEVPDGSEWLGSPAFSLPNRHKIGGFSDEVIFRPSASLYAQRAVIDGIRFFLPAFLALGFGWLSIIAMVLVRRNFGNLALFASLPLLAAAATVGLSALVVLLKKAIMGTFKPVIVPLWSRYVWWNEMLNGVYESVMAPLLVPLLGTPFVAPFLRAVGCKIGKRTYLDSTLFSEFDLVEIGDYAALNAGAIIQTHLFEDRVMKSSTCKVGAECAVGGMSVVLYDTEMQRASVLSSLSLLMKGETLAPTTRWHGIPTIQTR